MSNTNKQLPTWLYDWQTGFRIGLTGFILAWAISAHGQELSPKPLQPVPQPKQAEPPNEAETAKEEGLPVLVTPSEEQPESKQSSEQPVPKTKPDVQKKRIRKKIHRKSNVEQPQHKESHETWTLTITSGPSHVAGTPPQRETVTFEINPKSGQVINNPTIQEDAEVQEKTASEGKFPEQTPSKSVQPAQYQKTYNSIPYSRAEYLANPAYRHEATMEMLFGELRPTVIHKKDDPVRVYNQPRLDEGPAAHVNPLPWPWYYPTYGAAPLYWNRNPYWTPNSTYRRYSPGPYGSLYWRYYRPLGY